MMEKSLFWPAERMRQYLRHHHPEDYQLLDLRPTKLYGQRHIPGARSFPLAELPEHLHELSAERPVLLYCDSGSCSRAAAGILKSAGLHEVHALQGGFEAWQGAAAEGLPEELTSSWRQGRSAQEQTVLAWLLEENTRQFYLVMAKRLLDREASALFHELAAAEEGHKATLLALYEGLTGRKAPSDFPDGIVQEAAEMTEMEGGVSLQAALEWAEGRQIRDILAYAVNLEANALDRYLYLRRELADENAGRVFELLSDEEKRHLRKLGELLDHFV
jgi:sulfur-carrier protein adenylyltransferase/sulfurtransferase